MGILQIFVSLLPLIHLSFAASIDPTVRQPVGYDVDWTTQATTGLLSNDLHLNPNLIQTDNPVKIAFLVRDSATVDTYKLFTRLIESPYTLTQYASYTWKNFRARGMVCTFDGTNDPVLDYVIGNEEDGDRNALGLQVHRLDNTITGDNIVDTKYIYAPTNVTESIIVRNPAYTAGTPPSYVIVGGEYEKGTLQEVYFAKFSLEYWLTEWYDANEKYSVQYDDRLRGLVLDENNDQFYALLKVGVNQYNSSSLYEPNESADDDNGVLLGYSITGVLQWNRMFGDPLYIDEPRALSLYANELFIVSDNYSGIAQGTQAGSESDIMLTRYTTDGEYQFTSYYGSATDDFALSVSANHQGVYILAYIGDQFSYPNTGDTLKSGTATGYPLNAVAVIFVSLDDNELIETEVSHTSGNFYQPTLLITKLKSNLLYQFLYISIKSDNTGFYVTENVDTEDAFLEPLIVDGGAACNNHCQVGQGNGDHRWAHGDQDRCMICKDADAYIYNHLCYHITVPVLTGTNCNAHCPDYAFKVEDPTYVLCYCIPCHKNCKTCTGLRANQCASWESVDADPKNNRELDGTECLCVAPYGTTYGTSNRFSYKGECLNKCPIHQPYVKGTRLNECTEWCPEDRLPVHDWVTHPTTEDEDTYGTMVTDVHYLEFGKIAGTTNTYTGVRLQIPQTFDAMPPSFSWSLWVHPTAAWDVADQPVLSVGNNLEVRRDGSNSHVIYVLKTAGGNTITLTPGTLTEGELPLNEWTYLAGNKRKNCNNCVPGDWQFDIDFVVNDILVAQIQPSDAIAFTDMDTYSDSIVLGGGLDGSGLSTSLVFQGFIREFKLYDEFRTENALRADRFKTDISDWRVTKHLMAYWRFNETYTNTDSSFEVQDYSQYNQYVQISSLPQATGNFYPRWTVINLVSPGVTDTEIKLHEISSGNGLTAYRDVYKCVNVGAHITNLMVTAEYFEDPTYQTTLVDKQYLDLGQPVPNAADYVYSIDGALQDGGMDQVSLHNDISTKWQGTVSIIMEYDSTASTVQLAFNTVWPSDYNRFYGMTSGHYNVCFYSYKLDEMIMLQQIYIAEMPDHIEPENESSYSNSVQDSKRSFTVTGGDQVDGDELLFHPDCKQQTVFPTTDYATASRVNLAYTDVNFKGPFQIAGDVGYGEVYICWKPKFMSRAAKIRQSIWTITSFIPVSSIFDVRLDTTDFFKNLTPAQIPTYTATNFPAPLTANTIGPFDGDRIYVSQSDACQTNDFKNYVEYKYGQFPDMWFGNTQGIVYKDAACYLCYVSVALDTVANDLDVPFTIQDHGQGKHPEIVSIYPTYGQNDMLSDGYITITLDETIQTLTIYNFAYTYINDPITDYIMIHEEDPTTGLYSNKVFDLSGSNGTIEVNGASFNLKLAAGTVYNEGYNYKLQIHNDLVVNAVGNYLFGQETAQGIKWEYYFRVGDFDVVESSNPIWHDQSNLTMQGTNLDWAWHDYTLTGANDKKWLTEFIKIKLTVQPLTGSTVDWALTHTKPFATIKSWSNTEMTIEDLDLKGWPEGTVYAEFRIKRILSIDGDIRNSFRSNIKLGSIGCDTTCLTCNGELSSNCLTCATTHKLTSQVGSTDQLCVTSCVNPYYIEDNDGANCVDVCADGKYADFIDNVWKCLEWMEVCKTCSSGASNSCTTCPDDTILYDGTCISTCPYAYTRETNPNGGFLCQVDSTATPGYPIVTILDNGYNTKIPKEDPLYIRASIIDTPGTLTSVFWEKVNPSDNIGIFTGNTDRSTVQLDIAALDYDIYYRVKVTATNDIGTGFDYYEFRLNRAPSQGTFTYTPSEGTALVTEFTFTTGNWYDDDLGKKNLVYSVSYQIEGSDTKYPLVEEVDVAVSSTAKFPYLGEAATKVTLHLTCTDFYYGTSTIVQPDPGVSLWIYPKPSTSTLTDWEFLETNLDKVETIHDVLRATQSFVNLQPFNVLSNSATICTEDLHCHNLGTCVGNTCQCTGEWTGQFCQWANTTYNYLDGIFEGSLLVLENAVPTTELSVSEMNEIGESLSNMWQLPEMLDDNLFERAYNLTVDMNNLIDQGLAHRAGRDNMLNPIKATLGLLDVLQWNDRVYYSRFLNPYEWPSSTSYLELDEWQTDRQTQMEKIDEMFHTLLELYAGTITPGGDIQTIETRSMKASIHNEYSTALPNRTYEIGDSKITIPLTIWETLTNKTLANQEVHTFMIEWYNHPYSWTNDSMLIGSRPMSFEMRDSAGAALDIWGLTNPFEITIPRWGEHRFGVSHLDCAWWDKNKLVPTLEAVEVPYDSLGLTEAEAIAQYPPPSDWNQTTDPPYLVLVDKEVPINVAGWNYTGWGLVVLTEDVLRCRCTHLTEFAGVYNYTTIPSDSTDMKYYFDDSSSSSSADFWESLAFWYIVGVASVYLALLIAAIVVDLILIKRKIAYCKAMRRIKNLKDLPQSIKKARINKFAKKNKIAPMKSSVVSGYSAASPSKIGSKISKASHPDDTALEDTQQDRGENEYSGNKDATTNDNVFRFMMDYMKGQKGGEDSAPNPNAIFSASGHNQGKNIAPSELPPPKFSNPFEEIRKKKKIEQKLNDDKKIEQLKLIELIQEDADKKRKQCSGILARGMPWVNLVGITSITYPRHARLTLMMANYVSNMFWTAFFFRRTHPAIDADTWNGPLEENWTIDDAYIILQSAGITIVITYLLGGLFKIPEMKIKRSKKVSELEKAIKDMRKEKILRYIMSYFVATCAFGSVFSYSFQFSDEVGWQRSFSWLFLSAGAFVSDMIVISFLVSLFQAMVSCLGDCEKCSKVMTTVRELKQGVDET